jgi:uncharacterized Zn finger protein
MTVFASGTEEVAWAIKISFPLLSDEQVKGVIDSLRETNRLENEKFQ